MAKLRHVAFIVKDPDRLYDFYHHLFGVEKVRHGPTGAIHVIDGLFNLAFLKQNISDSPVVNTHRADGEEVDQIQGINHYGFLVDNVEQALKRFIDPWGNKVDLSARGFLGREEKKMPGVRHVVVQTDDPDTTAEFYKTKLELKEIGRLSDGTIRLSDGDISLDLTKKRLIDKPGIQSFGVQVESWSGTKSKFKELGIELPDPKPGQSEVTVSDPEGNLFTVSEKGWQL